MKFFTIRNAIATGLVLLFAGFAFYGFPDSPAPWFDEGLNLGIAKTFAEHGVFSLQIGPDEFVRERSLLITTNYPLLLWVAASFKLLGVGLAQAKIVMLIFLALFALLFYRLAKQHYGNDHALMALALLVTFLPFYGNGKSVLGEIPGLVYFLGGLLLLEKNRWWQQSAMGFLFGLAAVTKPVYLLFIISIAVGEVWEAIKKRHSDYRRWLFIVLGALIPMGAWIYAIFPMERAAEYAIKTLEHYRNPYKAEHTVLPNLVRFFRETTPIHFALLFLIVLFSKIAVKMRSLTRVEVILGVFIILDFIFYLKTAGWYRYFFPAHSLLFLIVPAALSRLTERFVHMPWKRHVPVVLIAIIFLVQLVHAASSIQQSFYYDPAAREFGRLVRERISSNESLLVVNHPEISFFLEQTILWQWIRINPYLVVGEDVFARDVYPRYVIADAWTDSEYLSQHPEIMRSYRLVAEAGKYHLYSFRDE